MSAAPVFQPSIIPAELRALPQWVCWRYETRNGKATKLPIDAKSNGKITYAKSNDPSTWTDFDTAVAAATRMKMEGIGLNVWKDDGLTGIDLDHVIDPATGELDPLAVEVLEQFANTYAEISPSGTGIRIWCYGKAARSGKCIGAVKWLEVYTYPSKRYLTLTGNHWPGSATAVTEQQAALDWLHSRFMVKDASTGERGATLSPVDAEIALDDGWGEPPPDDDCLAMKCPQCGAKAEFPDCENCGFTFAQPNPATTGGGSQAAPPVDASASLALDDQALLNKISQSKPGAAFDALWAGDTSAYPKDHSAADMALCNALAFWTGKDAPRMDRLFRKSGLMRPKWDEKHHEDGRTYGQGTIDRAIADCRETYSGGRKRRKPEKSGVTPNAKWGNSGVTEKSDINQSCYPVTPVTPSKILSSKSVFSFPSENDRPCYVVLPSWHEENGRKYRPGTYHCYMSDGKKNEEPEPVNLWFCSPLSVEAVTLDAQGNNFGRLLRFLPLVGKWRVWAMPMELLRGDGAELRGELLAMGVELHPTLARRMLGEYLHDQHPKRHIHCAVQVGWADDSFVLPDAVIGPNAANVIFQSGERCNDEHTQAGTLEGWKEGIAARAMDNPLLMLALSAGFAGPLLQRCNAEGGGIHFVGDSSTGKTTLIEAACSIWGGANYRRSWRATANGMEGAATLFNDCLLALDEISECDPREIGAIVYALANGRGKQRAGRNGSARSVMRWRCLVLSSGERTLATAMQEGGNRAKAGQSVRLLDIPVSQRYGAWDAIHDSPSPSQFSDAIKRVAATHHGHAGRAFLERLTRDTRDLCSYLDEFKALPLFANEQLEGQEKRALTRLALIGMAGELATEYGLTGWNEGDAIQAAALAFSLWLQQRPGGGNDEIKQIAERVSDFLSRHGDARFSDANDNGDGPVVRDRAGWWTLDDAGNRLYLFTAEAMREATKGFDFNRALGALETIGALPKQANGRRGKNHRICGRQIKLYPINSNLLEG